jgi:NADH-quinone oxidoreductase subunit J
MLQLILFFIFAALAVLGGIVVISHRNPIYSALFLVLTLFALAGEYVLLLAHFIAVVHVAVYAGAIMVLFLFVIMLLNIREEARAAGAFRYMIYIALPMAVILFVELGYLAFQGFQTATVQANTNGTVESIGNALFSTYVLPFEITSVLLLVAMAGALYLSKKKLSVANEEG